MGLFVLVALIGWGAMHGWFSGTDRAGMLAARAGGLPAGGKAGVALMRGATRLGNGDLRSILAVLLAIALLAVRRRLEALALIVAGLTIPAAVEITKALTARPRPHLTAWLDSPVTLSFPSGHAANSTVVYGALAIIAWRLFGPRAGVPAALAAAVLCAAIGVSRVYLGVHWPSDVAAGWALGGAWLCLFAAALRAADARAMTRG